MDVDQAFMKFLEKEEANKPCEYPDSNGVPTIGIGHKITISERRSGKIIINGVSVKYSKCLNSAQVYELCRQDVAKAVYCINSSVKVPLSQIQFNTLVSFAFNVGNEAFKNSTLLKKLNKGLYLEVPDQLRRWIHDDGEIVTGLINRRKHEIDLWDSDLKLG